MQKPKVKHARTLFSKIRWQGAEKLISFLIIKDSQNFLSKAKIMLQMSVALIILSIIMMILRLFVFFPQRCNCVLALVEVWRNSQPTSCFAFGSAVSSEASYLIRVKLVHPHPAALFLYYLSPRPSVQHKNRAGVRIAIGALQLGMVPCRVRRWISTSTIVRWSDLRR